MATEQWTAYMMFPRGVDQLERERMLERAGVGYGLGWFATEAEAKAAAEDALQKIKSVGGEGWAAAYVAPFMDRTNVQWNPNPTPRVIH